MRKEITRRVSVAFKEWSLICDALANGSQSLILRKGGIAEGVGGFTFEHDSFWFFPTQFHTQQDLVLSGAMNPHVSRFRSSAPAIGEPLQLDLLGEIVCKGRLDRWQQVEKLQGFHQWKDEVLRERFDYGEPAGLNFALLRVYQADNPLQLTMQRSFGGCRSWIELPETADLPRCFHPVIAEDEHTELRQKFESLLQPQTSA